MVIERAKRHLQLLFMEQRTAKDIKQVYRNLTYLERCRSKANLITLERFEEAELAIAVIISTLSPFRDVLTAKQIIPILYGSIEFHDQEDMDVDLLWASPRTFESDSILDVGVALRNDLFSVWPRSTVPEFDIGNFFSLTGLGEEIQGNQPYDRKEILGTSLHQSYKVLCGEVLFPEHTPLFHELQTGVFNHMRTDRRLRDLLVVNLGMTANMRRQRRLGYKLP